MDLSEIQHIFFDLDATLLGLPDKVLETEYPKLIVKHFRDVLEPKTFLTCFWKSTLDMFQHTDYTTNVLSTFINSFLRSTGMEFEDVYQRFEHFYSTDFDQIKVQVEDLPIVPKLISKLKSMDIRLFLATNPIFPEIATRKRVSWAKLDYDEDFEFVTNAQNWNSVKPDLKYFNDLLAKFDLSARTTLMVGNDYLIDGAASKVGIKTWITTKYPSNENKKNQVNIDYVGSLEDLYDKFN